VTIHATTTAERDKDTNPDDYLSYVNDYDDDVDGDIGFIVHEHAFTRKPKRNRTDGHR
jgi:hypothetical protein